MSRPKRTPSINVMAPRFGPRMQQAAERNLLWLINWARRTGQDRLADAFSRTLRDLPPATRKQRKA